MALAAAVAGPISAYQRRGANHADTPVLFESLPIREALASRDCRRLVTSGVSSVTDYFCDHVEDLVRIAISNDENSTAAYFVISSEIRPILNQILTSRILNTLMPDILESDTPNRQMLIPFVSTVRLCLMRGGINNIQNVDFLAKFLQFSDEVCICDLFLSIATSRNHNVCSKLLFANKVLDEAVVQIQKKPDAANLFRILTYFSCISELKEGMSRRAFLEPLIVNMAERDAITQSCMWNYFSNMVCPATFEVLKCVIDLAIETLMHGDRFGLLESNALDFLVRCCETKESVAERVLEAGIFPELMQRLSKLPNSSSCLLRILQHCRELHSVLLMRQPLANLWIEAASKWIEEREQNIPRAAVAWQALLEFQTWCVDTSHISESAAETVRRLEQLAEEEYGREAPSRPIELFRRPVSEMTPDEIVSLFVSMTAKYE